MTLLGFLLLAVFVHEAGHALTAHLLGYPVRPILTWRGVGIRWGTDTVRSPDRDKALVALAGPVASLALTLLAVFTHRWLLAGISLELVLWNLVLPHSDGRHAWKALR